MFSSWCKAALAAQVGFLAASCAPSCPPVQLDTAGVRPSADTSLLAVVLKEALDAHGRVRPRRLKAQADRLRAQLALLAVTGPTATPRLVPAGDAALAYWYNARAAWSLALLLACDCPAKLSERHIAHVPLRLDGRDMSLADIDAALAADGDFRVPAAAPGVTLDRAVLPDSPFAAGDVRRRVAERFCGLIDDEDRFVVRRFWRQVLVPPVLYDRRQRIIDACNRANRTEGATLITALLAHVDGSAYRRLQDAIGYAPRPRDTDATCVEED